ncbi:MAG: TolB family protein, partial [bacterium]
MNLFGRQQLIFGTILTVIYSTLLWGMEDNDKDESQFLSNTRQLTYEGKRAGEGYFSEDGKALIFQSERETGNPFFQMYILDLETGETHRVSPGVGKTTCAFFRPGTNEVLFASTHLDPRAEAKQKAEIEFRAAGKKHRYAWDYDEYMDIFSSNRDGSNLKQLTKVLGYDAEGSYSPDGRKIVFCSLRDAYPLKKLPAKKQKQFEVDPAYFGEIYIMNADGTDPTRLTNWPGYDGGPFFTPDGERIVWRHFEENGMRADVFTMRLDGSDVRRLTEFDAMSWAPYFHPSGKYVIFSSNKLGFSNFELYMVDASGKHEPVRVTYTDGFDGLPAFSPDGKRLCWTSNRTSDNRSQLFIAGWNHAAALAAISAAPLRNANPAEVTNSHTSSSVAVPNLAKETKNDDQSLSPNISRNDLRSE